MSDYLSLTRLGQLYGMTSHKMGKFMRELGLRDKEGDPTRAAYLAGLVKKVPTGRGDYTYWVWHPEQTIAILEAAGLKMVGAAVESPLA